MLARQMKYLRSAGYSTIDLDVAVQSLASGEIPAKSVVITFDDGYRDFYTHACPILREHGFSATLFLATAWIGDQRVQLNGNGYLTWAEIRELHANGISIGSHTVTHPELKTLPPAGIEHEIRESKQTLEDAIGVSVSSFSYPYAFPETDLRFVGRLETMLDSAGYENGVSTMIGRAGPRHNRFFLPRLPVNSWDDLSLFQVKLEGGYDWLHGPQYAVKFARGLIRNIDHCLTWARA